MTPLPSLHGSYEHLLTLANLERAGLFTVKNQSETGGTRTRLQKRFDLLTTSDGAGAPSGPPAVFYGHSPLSVHVVAHVVRAPLVAADLETTLGVPVATLRRPAPAAAGGAAPLLVVFVGGVTCAELTALRAVAAAARSPLVVLATDVVNGTSLVESMFTA